MISCLFIGTKLVQELPDQYFYWCHSTGLFRVYRVSENKTAITRKKYMKTGKTIVELAKELTRIKETAKDYVVPTERLYAEVVQEDAKEKLVVGFTNGTKHRFGINEWSGSQISTYTDIPKNYFDRLKSENPVLLADNINHGFEKITRQAKAENKPESRMLRTLDGNIRGMLSSRYRILDAYDMLEAVFPVLSDQGMNIVSSELTERRMFIKALSPKLQSEVKKGDVVQYGLTISTSDVGSGSVRVEPLLFRLVCENGLISDTAMRKYHVGRNQAEDDVRELLSDNTRALTDSAFWAQVRDITLASMKPENFERQVDKLRVAAGEEIKNFDLPRVVELTMAATGVKGETKKNSIVAALASGNEGAGLTKWGLINAFTRAAQDASISYEDSIEMERAAGQILELPKTSWSHIAAVA